MACAADGSVRVWRGYAQRGQQRLATAWQAVLVAAAGSPTRPAVYHWSPCYSALFAAGGRSAGEAQRLTQECHCACKPLAAVGSCLRFPA